MIKVTKREKFEMLLGLDQVKENTLLVEFINHELELLAKKNGKSASGEKSLTPTQKQNETVKTEILVELQNQVNPIQIKEMELVKSGKYTNQKISALMKQLVTSGEVERIEDKKVTTFKISDSIVVVTDTE